MPCIAIPTLLIIAHAIPRIVIPRPLITGHKMLLLIILFTNLCD